MTISNEAVRVAVVGNGAQTIFNYSFIIPSQSVAQLWLEDTTTGNLTLLSQAVWTLQGAGNPTGGTFTYPLSGSPISATDRLLLIRTVPATQLTQFLNQGAVYPAAIEGGLDWIVMQVQQLAADLQRAALVPLTEDAASLLPAYPGREGTILGFDASGNFISFPPGSGEGLINSMDIIDATTAGRLLLTSDLATQKAALNIQPEPTTGAVSQAVYAVAPGTGYNLGDVLTVVGGTGTPATFTVITTRLISCALLAPGSGYAINDEIQLVITVSGQVYVNARLRVLTVGGGGSIATFTIIDSGEYGPATLPTTFMSGPITGVGTGATFNTPVWGVGQAYVQSAGNYTVFPGAVVATTGGGTGATLPLRWGDDQIDLRTTLGNPARVESYSTYLRTPGVGWQGFAGPDGDQQYLWFITNDRTTINPYTGEVLGDDSKWGINVSDFSLTSTQDRRSPEDNTTRLLQTVFFQLVRDVPNPAAGSLLFSLFWAGRTTGASFVDMYYGAITGTVIDPAAADPRGAMIFSTAAPAAVPGSSAGRVWIGQGLYTAQQLTSGVATSPLTDTGTGTINAMRVYTQNGLRIDENGNFFGNGAQLADLTLTNALTTDRLYLTGAQMLTFVNGDNNNVAMNTNAWVRCAGPTGAWAITGIAGGASGEVRYVYNASGFALTIKNENAGSTAANRILTSTGADVVLGAGRVVAELHYDPVDARWILM